MPAIAKRKPSKARKHLKAGEPAKAALYHWEATLDGGYAFNPVDSVSAVLTPADGEWHMLVEVDGKRYAGARPTLEDAFKATDRLLYKQARDYWVKSICRAVLEPWAATIPEA